MGWWWSSSSSPGAEAKPDSQQPPSTTLTSIPPPPTTSKPPSTAETDFYAAHPHLAPSPSTTNSSSHPSTTSESPSENYELDPTLPRTMSCRAAFDSAFYCSSFGGHFNDIYRYGHLRSCSEHWSDFWWCMRLKNNFQSPEIKEQLVQQRYREKEERLRQQPNSEDVWKRRGKGEEVRNPFGRAEEEARRVEER